MKVFVSQATHSGRERESNEDACLVDEITCIVVLCDGVGGHEAGEVASQMGCTSVVASVNAGRSLPDAVHAAHDVVMAAATGGREGMATTLVAAHIVGNKAELVWAGDSCAYLLDTKKGRCQLLTPPHSLVSELVALGKLTAEEAKEHPMRHRITQCLGIKGRPFKPSNLQLSLRDGDRLLLCSDGVSDVLDEAALWKLAGPEVDVLKAADALVNEAVELSGHDNTTAIVLEVALPPSPLKRWVRKLLR